MAYKFYGQIMTVILISVGLFQLILDIYMNDAMMINIIKYVLLAIAVGFGLIYFVKKSAEDENKN